MLLYNNWQGSKMMFGCGDRLCTLKCLKQMGIKGRDIERESQRSGAAKWVGNNVPSFTSCWGLNGEINKLTITSTMDPHDTCFGSVLKVKTSKAALYS